MYYRGEWTWSNFEKYMGIISEYCESYTGFYKIVPFETNYTYFAEQALHSVGASVYDGENVNAATPEAISAVEFAAGLFEKGLVSYASAEKNANNSGWLSGTEFTSGKTFFTNCAPWKIRRDYSGNGIGIVPFPYPDGTNPVLEKGQYFHLNHGGDSVGLVKGINEETSRLAVFAYKTYINEYSEAMGIFWKWSDAFGKYTFFAVILLL